MVRTVKEAEISQTPLRDIFLPLPGADVQLPENEIKDWYVQLLQDDGISMDYFNTKTKQVYKRKSLSGLDYVVCQASYYLIGRTSLLSCRKTCCSG